MGFSIYLPSLLFGLSLHHSLIAAQNSVGSFFTAIYLNGAAVAPGQVSCSEMGQSQYCCGTGQSCAWDDAGKVACCASGYNCQGSAYSSNAGAAGQYYTPSTTTIYQSPNCNCQSSTVVPIVPVTVATVVSPKVTSYYNPPTSTYYPPTTTTTYAPYITTTTAVGGQAAEANTCSNGYTTLVEAHVGTPTRVVNCYVIINEGGRRAWGQSGGKHALLVAMSFFTILMRWLE